MTLIVAGCAHGSPGVTTTLELVGACWPDRSHVPVIVEADMAGGVIAARHLIPATPGMASLVEALRRNEEPSILDHAQQLPSGVAAIPLVPSMSVAANQLRAAEATLGPYLSSCPETVFADLGTVIPGSPSERLLMSADLVLWFVRPVREEITMLDRRLKESATAIASAIVLVGASPYGADEVNAALGAAVIHTVAFDPKGAGAFRAGGANRVLGRSKLLRSCRTFADKLHEHVHAVAPGRAAAPALASTSSEPAATDD